MQGFIVEIINQSYLQFLSMILDSFKLHYFRFIFSGGVLINSIVIKCLFRLHIVLHNFVIFSYSNNGR